MYFDREEDALVPDDLDFSPQPPAAPGFALCWEANVIGINGSSVLGGGYNHSNLDLAFEKGWMAFDFTGSVSERCGVAGSEATIAKSIPARATSRPAGDRLLGLATGQRRRGRPAVQLRWLDHAQGRDRLHRRLILAERRRIEGAALQPLFLSSPSQIRVVPSSPAGIRFECRPGTAILFQCQRGATDCATRPDHHSRAARRCGGSPEHIPR